MNYGISGLSLIPVRKEPSEKSEMITQVLYGEHFEILERMVGWCHIKFAFDGYVGWADQKMITPISQRTFKKIEKSPSAVTTDVFTIIPVNDEQNMMIVAGSTLPVWRPYKKVFRIEREVLPMSGNVSYGKIKNVRGLIISQSLKYFNAPYLWGGRSPFGIDCSGFTQIIYKMGGIKLPRDASEQVHCGTVVSFIEETQPGDLAFFDDEEGNITHVGIIWKRNKIIHASGKVRIDNVDQFGVFNIDTKRYTHKMRVMKRIIP
ncbi:Dipeptidyl peptidase VI [hydrothermal vent metagenome]|uniref:Dipeptidyl peptidase VI n=1 Tax=hydrothermal vent metagenome TaxID=652676 RepID=A0A3B0TXY4_9ZZZZ